jgi:DNA anti-recombination protein RmuC
MNDVKLLVERAGKLETHFRQAQEDLAGIGAASARVARRGERIEAMDFSDDKDAESPTDLLRLARGAERERLFFRHPGLAQAVDKAFAAGVGLWIVSRCP